MFRISLRELLALVACCALALVSLKYASEAWLTAVLGRAMLAFFVAVIVAAVDRGPRQAFGPAFVLVAVTYGWIVLKTPQFPGNAQSPGSAEFELWRGHLPTTLLLWQVYIAVVHDRWIDNSTDKEIANFDPANPSIPISNFGAGGGMVAVATGPTASSRQFPSQENFAPIGHMWWALLFGYIGGRFGQFICRRRTSEPPSEARL